VLAVNTRLFDPAAADHAARCRPYDERLALEQRCPVAVRSCACDPGRGWQTVRAVGGRPRVGPTCGGYNRDKTSARPERP